MSLGKSISKWFHLSLGVGPNVANDARHDMKTFSLTQILDQNRIVNVEIINRRYIYIYIILFGSEGPIEGAYSEI